MYKKVVKFSFTKQKIFWVLVLSFMYLVSVDPMNRSSTSDGPKIFCEDFSGPSNGLSTRVPKSLHEQFELVNFKIQQADVN